MKMRFRQLPHHELGKLDCYWCIFFQRNFPLPFLSLLSWTPYNNFVKDYNKENGFNYGYWEGIYISERHTNPNNNSVYFTGDLSAL